MNEKSEEKKFDENNKEQIEQSTKQQLDIVTDWVVFSNILDIVEETFKLNNYNIFKLNNYWINSESFWYIQKSDLASYIINNKVWSLENKNLEILLYELLFPFAFSNNSFQNPIQKALNSEELDNQIIMLSEDTNNPNWKFVYLIKHRHENLTQVLNEIKEKEKDIETDSLSNMLNQTKSYYEKVNLICEHSYSIDHLDKNIEQHILNMSLTEKNVLENEIKNDLISSKSADLAEIIKLRVIWFWKTDISKLSAEHKMLYTKLYTYCYITQWKSPDWDYVLRLKYNEIKNTLIKNKYIQKNHAWLRNLNPWNISYCEDENWKAYPKWDEWRAKKFVKFPNLTVWREEFLKTIDNRKKGISKIYKPDMTILDFFKEYNKYWYIDETNKACKRLWIWKNTKIKDIPTFKFAVTIANLEDDQLYKALKDEWFIDSLYYQNKYK